MRQRILVLTWNVSTYVPTPIEVLQSLQSGLLYSEDVQPQCLFHQ